MNEEDYKNQIHELKKQLNAKENELQQSELRQTANFAGRIANYLMVGPKLLNSIENLIKKQKHDVLALHEKEVAAVIAALISRFWFMFAFGVCVSLVPALAIVYQTWLIGSQNRILTNQLAEDSQRQVDTSQLMRQQFEFFEKVNSANEAQREMTGRQLKESKLLINDLGNARMELSSLSANLDSVRRELSKEIEFRK